MTIKRTFLAILTLLVIAAAIGLFATRKWEPEHQGKKLSQWVMEVENPSSVWNGFTSPKSHRAVEGVRRIGTNALPFLLKWINQDTPPWKKHFYRAGNFVVSRLNSHWSFRDKYEKRAECAEAAFYGLRHEQQNMAIPELTRIINNTNDLNAATNAVLLLSYLGKDGEIPIQALLTNQQQSPALRAEAIRCLGGMMESNMKSHIHLLSDLLTDASPIVRGAATNRLGVLKGWEALGSPRYGRPKTPPRVTLDIINASSKPIDWVGATIYDRELFSVEIPNGETTLLDYVWSSSEATITFIDDKTGQAHSTTINFYEVNMRVVWGECKHVKIRILDYDKVEAFCE